MASYYKTIVITLALLLLVGLGIREIYTSGEESGYNAATSKHEKAVADANKRAQDMEIEFNKFKEQSERDIQQKLEILVNYYLDGVEDAKNKTDDIVTDLRNDNLRLSVNLKRAQTTTGKCDVRTDTPTSGGNNETERAELSAEDAEFFIRFSKEADDRVRQLTACQSLVTTYSEQAAYFKEMIRVYRENYAKENAG